MTMKIGFLIAFIYLTAASAAPAANDDIVIECEYMKDEEPKDSDTYTCNAKITSSLSAPNGTPIKIMPIDEMQRLKVETFELKNFDISNHFDNILKAVGTTFPNIDTLTLVNISIRDVSKDNLKWFPELKLIDLGYNKITVLESDLFMYTPKIKFINFESNMIAKVDDKFLNSFDSIMTIFTSNPCIEQSTCESMVDGEKLKNEYPELYTRFYVQAVVGGVLTALYESIVEAL